MAPLIFVSDMGTAPQIPKGFFASDHERSAEHPARMMIDKEYSSVPAVITMSRQALDRLLLSPRHDFDEAIGLLPAIYLDEKTGRFIERKRELSHTQDMRSIGIRQSSFDARCLHALMEALDDLPVVTIFWTAISQASSFNAVSFRNAKTWVSMSDRAFASDYPHGFLDQLKPIKPLFVSAIDGSELLQADRAGNQRQAFSKNPHIKNIPAEAGIEEIARSLRMSLVPMLESDLSPTNRYRRYK